MTLIEVVAQETGEPGAVLPHPSEIIVGFIAFACIVYVVGRYAWPMFTRSHREHNERVAGGMQRAEREQQTAQDELGRNRAKLAQVDAESARLRDDARGDAERIKEDMASRAQEEADRVVAQGRQTLDASRARAVSELRGEVGRQSVELAGRIVTAALSDDTRRGESVDGFLDELETMAGRDPGRSGGSGQSGDGERPTSRSSGTGATRADDGAPGGRR